MSKIWDFFYLGFPAKFSQKLRFSFLKGFQAKKRLVLHVLCQSHPCASLARTVLKPSHAIDLLPAGCEKVKSEVKVTPFLVFIFPETYIYYRSYIYIYRYQRKLCTTTLIHLSLQQDIVHNNFLMGVKFWTSWGVAPTIFKITLLRWLFSKMVSNLWFFENLHGIFHIKLKAIFFNGISFENWRRFWKFLRGFLL